MLNLLKNFFDTQNLNEDSKNDNQILHILCGLMIEAANTDGQIDQGELTKINTILVDTFKENPSDVQKYIDKAIEDRNNTNSLFHYTSKINKEFSHDKKILLLETLWEIVLSDGAIHDYESSLIRRLSGLLYISDIDSGNAKKRALNKISIK